MEKVIREGKVGVLVSPGWGGGFSTWGYPTEAIFDPTLIELVENEKLMLGLKIYLNNPLEFWFGK